ncbi:YdcF family protein [Curvibacter sp. CHRR-16]|uniref:YdcF family protein n=1 Tax=Curvibacter sp. CHRR-16 TaxID=2835872 RepID=UPI001BDA6FFF|nr:YdcF family protein [Curvibacter sp. CHRR-16]MBT0569009.1 YdcF family protein [Curvibacter sp. CHRR-16]
MLLHTLTHYLGALLEPIAAVTALLVLGCVLQWLGRRPQRKRLALWAWRMQVVGVVALLLLGWQAVPQYGLYWLESRYALPATTPDAASLRQYRGVVVLGGGTASGRLQAQHPQQVLFNEAGERLVVSALVAKAHPQLTLLYTGGEGDPLGIGPSEAERARQFYQAMGVPAQQVVYEGQSRTTYENALRSAELPGIDRQQPWLLMTSAWHMPRSMATFQKAGWNVTAYPVDYQGDAQFVWYEYSLIGGANSWSTLAHELLGILAYKLQGKA